MLSFQDTVIRNKTLDATAPSLVRVRYTRDVILGLGRLGLARQVGLDEGRWM